MLVHLLFSAGKCHYPPTFVGNMLDHPNSSLASMGISSENTHVHNKSPAFFHVAAIS